MYLKLKTPCTSVSSPQDDPVPRTAPSSSLPALASSQTTRAGCLCQASAGELHHDKGSFHDQTFSSLGHIQVP